MKRGYQQIIAGIFGIGAIIAYFSVMEINEPIAFALAVCGGIYLLFGIFVGMIFPDSRWFLGFWLATPAMLIIVFSFLFAGIFTPKILTSDIPLLFTLTIAACIGVYLGTQLRSLLTKTP